MSFPPTDRNRVRRIPDRGHYDKETVYEILDAASLCHVGFSVDEQTFVIPTLFGRDGDAIFLHGSAASRMLNAAAGGIDICLTVTHVDGLVLARSAFHHSMNYRSAVLFGRAVEVADDEKLHGLFVISENVIKGRWDEVRPPAAQELKATSVLRMEIESASAKVRNGPPSDEDEDYELPVWAGVVPLQVTCGSVENDPQLRDGIEVSPSVQRFMEDPR